MTDQPQLRVAVIDVDSGFLQVLGKRAEHAGWEIRMLGSPVRPDDLVALRLNALVVNLAVLGGGAWEYLESVCTALPGIGVVVCTGQSSVAQRVRGLRMGADDWVTKPCHPEEVIARVQAVVRRRRSAVAAVDSVAPSVFGELVVRADHFQAYVGEESVELTRREFELLQLLTAASGRVLEREEIYARVWGYAMARGDRSVDVFVRKVRQKLEKASPTWRYIHTHFGVGYRFAPEPVEGGDVVPGPAVASAPVPAPSAAVVADAVVPDAVVPDAVPPVPAVGPAPPAPVVGDEPRPLARALS